MSVFPAQQKNENNWSMKFLSPAKEVVGKMIHCWDCNNLRWKQELCRIDITCFVGILDGSAYVVYTFISYHDTNVHLQFAQIHDDNLLQAQWHTRNFALGAQNFSFLTNK